MKQKLAAIISLIALALIMAITSCAPIIEGTGGYGSGGGSSGESSSAGGGSSGGGSPSSGGGSSSSSGPFFTLKITASNRRSAEDNLRASVTYEPVVTWTTEQGFRNAVKEFSVRVGNEAPQTVSLGGSVTSRTSYSVGSEVTVSYTAYADVEFTASDGSSKTRTEVIASDTKRVRVAAQGTTVNFKVSAGLQTPESFTDESTGPKPTPDPEPQPQPVKKKFSVSYSLDGGDWSPDSEQPQTTEYTEGDTVTVTANVPTKPSFTFLGWKASVGSLTPSGGGDTFAAGSTFTMPSAAVTFTAQWATLITVDGNTTLASAFATINGYPAGTSVTISVAAGDQDISGEVKLSTAKTVTIRGNGGSSVIKSSASGAKITLANADARLILENVTLDLDNKAQKAVSVESGATLEIKDGTVIKNLSSSTGTTTSAVSVMQNGGGNIIMSGGAIQDCNGNGVTVYCGSFTMTGGEIKNCETGIFLGFDPALRNPADGTAKVSLSGSAKVTSNTSSGLKTSANSDDNIRKTMLDCNSIDGIITGNSKTQYSIQQGIIYNGNPLEAEMKK